MFRASMCPSSGENCCIYATLVFVTLYGWRRSAGWIHQEKIAVSMRHWYLSLCMGGVWYAGWIEIQPAEQTQPIQSDKYQCRIDTVIFPWWWAHGCPKHEKRREINILSRTVHLVRFICEIIQGWTVNKTKFMNCLIISLIFTLYATYVYLMYFCFSYIPIS